MSCRVYNFKSACSALDDMHQLLVVWMNIKENQKKKKTQKKPTQVNAVMRDFPQSMVLRPAVLQLAKVDTRDASREPGSTAVAVFT